MVGLFGLQEPGLRDAAAVPLLFEPCAVALLCGSSCLSDRVLWRCDVSIHTETSIGKHLVLCWIAAVAPPDPSGRALCRDYTCPPYCALCRV